MWYYLGYLLIVCISTRPTGSSKYSTFHKNTQGYSTSKHPLRHIYITYLKSNHFNTCPGLQGNFLFILPDKTVMSSVTGDNCTQWFFFHPNFVKPYQSSKAPSSCLRAGKIFIRHEIAQIYQFTGHILKENVIQENLILLFQCKSFWQKAAKRLNFHAAIKP